MSDLQPDMRIDYAWKMRSIGTIVKNIMKHKRDRFQREVNALIDKNMSLQDSGNPRVTVRGVLFAHSFKPAPAVPRNRPAPRLSLHLDLFDQGNRIYIQALKLDNDEKMISQTLGLMMSNAETVQEFRDALMPFIDRFAKPLDELSRVNPDPTYLLAPKLVEQVEEMRRIISVYAMAELMEE